MDCKKQEEVNFRAHIRDNKNKRVLNEDSLKSGL